MRKSGSLLAAVAVFCFVASAQKPVASGAVTGHVTCADTNTPARLAVVVLRPVPAAKNASSKLELKTVEARRVQTMLDGSFSISNVAPGTYFVLASMPGYISPLASLGAGNDDLLEPTSEMKKRLIAAVPTITVEANGPTSVNLSLERAAAVNGTVLYDDGSPAPGVEVKLREKRDGKWVPVQNIVGDGMGSGNASTDDRGNYRITGLPEMKETIVEADLRIQNSNLSFGKNSFATYGGLTFTLAFYSGNALRPSEAKPFHLSLGEERPGEDITLPLSKLHNIKGVLLAKADGHILNDGSVTLLFADDHTELGNADVESGNEKFDFPFVPVGDYVLKVNYAADALIKETPNPPGSVPSSTTEKTAIHTYAATEMPLHVDRDLTNLTVEVPDRSQPARSVGQP